MQHEITPSGSSLGDAPTAELVELALRQTGELVRAEATLATEELKADAFGALVATINMVAAVVLLVLAVALGAVGGLLFAGTGLPAALLITAGGLVVCGLVAAIVGVRLAPKRILEHSRERVAAEIRQIEDHAS